MISPFFMYLLLRITYTVSHKFWYLMFFFFFLLFFQFYGTFNIFLNFSFWHNFHSWSSFQFSCICKFPVFLLLLFLIYDFNLWWSDEILGVVSIFLYLLRLALCPSIQLISETVPWAAENIYSVVFWRNVL